MGNQSKYAVISDVHANGQALRAVLRDIKQRGIQSILFLGDAVGYGPEPNESVDLLNSECQVMIVGNHDRGAIGLADTGSFNESAKTAIAWTEGILTGDSREVLLRAPLKTEVKTMDITLVHASPYEPESWHYILKLADAEKNFRHMYTAACFVGHSHRPFIIEMSSTGELNSDKLAMKKREGNRYIINAGSIGQPRDGDPRACYVAADDDGYEIIRVSYDISATQKKMSDNDLPRPLIDRLAYGL